MQNVCSTISVVIAYEANTDFIQINYECENYETLKYSFNFTLTSQSESL